MSLNYNLSAIENWQQVCFARRSEPPEGAPRECSLEDFVEEQPWFMGPSWEMSDDGTEIVRMNAITFAFCFLSQSVMMGDITEKNYKEVYLRWYMIERASGARLQTATGEPRYITLEDVKAHIGLKVNVAIESKAKFKNNLMRILREDAERSFEASPQEES